MHKMNANVSQISNEIQQCSMPLPYRYVNDGPDTSSIFLAFKLIFIPGDFPTSCLGSVLYCEGNAFTFTLRFKVVNQFVYGVPGSSSYNYSVTIFSNMLDATESTGVRLEVCE